MMLNFLKGHLLWEEMKILCSVDDRYLSENLEIKRVGNTIYIDKKSIRDPLLKMEAEACTVLDKFYPVSTLSLDLNLSDYHTKELRKSKKHTVNLYGVYLFKIPEIFFNDVNADRKMMVHSLLDSEEDDGYETVMKINKSFKIVGYSL